MLWVLYSTSRQAEQLEKGCNMQLLSREAELELLEKVGDHSGTTLNNWEKHGLKPYQSPFENSKKIYYRKTDIYNFLAVD